MDRERVFRATIHNRLEEVGEVTQQIEAFCEQWDATVKQHYFVQMTVEEVCSAIVEKGFQGREGVRGIIQITLVADRDGMFTLHVRDSASTSTPSRCRRRTRGPRTSISTRWACRSSRSGQTASTTGGTRDSIRWW